MLTCTPQNGPIHLLSNYSLVENQYAWSNVADYVWLDQPVYVHPDLLQQFIHTFVPQRNWIQYG